MESILTQTLMNRRARVDAKQIIQGYATEDRQSQNVDGRTYDHGLEQQHFENRLAELQDRARILGDNPSITFTPCMAYALDNRYRRPNR